MVSIDYLLACYHRPTVNSNCYEVGMAESPLQVFATVVSAVLHCDLVSILFGDLT